MSIEPKYGTRARLGLIVPSGNIAAEPQFLEMLPKGIGLHTTRLKLMGSAPEELMAMTENVEEAAQLTADAKPDLIAFHCTAVTTMSDELEASILQRAGTAGVPVIATSQAIVAALEALEARKLVLLSPYVPHINESEVRFLERRGVATIDETGLGLNDPASMFAVEPAQWREMALSHRNPDADAYFISCTAVRSLEVVAELEAELGKPVITSNLVMGWYALRKMGFADQRPDLGTLFSRH